MEPLKGFEDLKFEPNPHLPGLNRAEVDFPNGWGVSVISGGFAYADDEHPYELAVLRGGHLHYDNPVADGDVQGHLTADDVTRLMHEVQKFAPTKDEEVP